MAPNAYRHALPVLLDRKNMRSRIFVRSIEFGAHRQVPAQAEAFAEEPYLHANACEHAYGFVHEYMHTLTEKLRQMHMNTSPDALIHEHLPVHVHTRTFTAVYLAAEKTSA
jgi:hypothetical protein